MECGSKGGMRTAYWTTYDQIDWATMAADNTKWDSTNRLILEYVMQTGGSFKQLEFNKKSAFYDFDFTDETSVWTQLLTFFFFGQDNALKNSIDKATGCCNIIFHIFTTDGKQRMVGAEWNGTSFEIQTEPLIVTRVKDSSGQRGSSKPRYEVDLGGESDCAPLYATVVEGDIPLL